ncbi:MAG: hypothetical protein M3R53_03360 [Candidatus Eremiobacteraeota bacterium]|nr:hypothetical protein [Candidatus Eremiobacteraeota bacterium]
MKRLVVALLVAGTLLSGCKKPSVLERADAQNILQTALFSGPRATQTLDFTSGAIASHPLALEQFLYAKHWLDCSATAPGSFTTSAVCRLNAEGRTFGSANGWTWLPATEKGCERCETVHVPLAVARLTAVSAVDIVDDSHATVAYAYQVVPNPFGVQLAGWMAGHALAWCGPDPAARGGWNAQRSTKAALVRSNAGWLPQETLAPDFAGSFAPAETADSGKPCPGS